MITWMQKHRKYLVVTIWVASISFIGAGFVGWGAYSMGQSGSTVAEVGDIEVSVGELQQEYSNLFRMYNQMLGGKFDQDQAKKMGLQDQAIKNLIIRASLLNYADEMGIVALDEEIAERIAKNTAFHKDGKFDKSIYFELLKQNRMKASDYEAMMKKDIIIEKINSAFKTGLTDLEKEVANAAFFIEDNIRIDVLNLADIQYILNEDDLKAYWESNKENYKTKKTYTLSMITTPLDFESVNEEEAKTHYETFKTKFTDSEGKIQTFEEAKEEVFRELAGKAAKKSALKQYLELKKGKMENPQTLTLAEDDTTYGSELLEKLGAVKPGETIKPVLSDKGYVSATVTAIEPKKTKTYEQARADVKPDFVAFKKRELLKEQAEKTSALFAGNEIGFVKRDDTKPLESYLSTQEAQLFLRQLFESRDSKGYVMLEERAVVYEILEQRLLSDSQTAQNSEFVNQSTLQMKQRLIEDSLISMLQKRYKEETIVR